MIFQTSLKASKLHHRVFNSHDINSTSPDRENGLVKRIGENKMTTLDTILCPKCGAPNVRSAMNCAGCRINLAWAFEHPELNLAHAAARDESGIQASELPLAEGTLSQQSMDAYQMYKSIQSWAILFLIWGGLSIILGSTFDADPVWGVLMVVVAALSWKVKIPGMFLLYAVMMGWAALTNGLSIFTGVSWWAGFALFQVYWAYSLVMSYRKYSQVGLQDLYQSGPWPANLPAPQNESTIAYRFAAAGVILSAISLILLPGACIVSIAVGMANPSAQGSALEIALYGASVDIAVLALGLICIALFSKTINKGPAIAGAVMSVLTMILWLGLFILGILMQ